jgi:hypothetical protein
MNEAAFCELILLLEEREECPDGDSKGSPPSSARIRLHGLVKKSTYAKSVEDTAAMSAR